MPRRKLSLSLGAYPDAPLRGDRPQPYAGPTEQQILAGIGQILAGPVQSFRAKLTDSCGAHNHVGSPRLPPPLGSQIRTKKRNVHLYLGHARIV